MIYCKDKFDEKYMLDDELNIKGSSSSGIKIIEMLIEKLEPFAPEKGSPTLTLIDELKKNGFEIINFELPLIEQVEDIVY